jgi:peptide/nickel transport system ATP-binding protein
MSPMLEVQDLRVGYRSGKSLKPAVDGVSFSVDKGETLGIVGESGCGKSTLARALLGYFRPGSAAMGGAVRFEGADLLRCTIPQLRALRGRRIAMVPQNPLSSLTYHLKVGEQVDEILRVHRGLKGSAARRETLALFSATRLPHPERIYERYPHEISGGQRQRVVIAAALACEPALMVLDEPTTALDTTTEMQVLGLVKELQRRIGMALIYITHDLTLIRYMCEQVQVMLDGVVVERGAVAGVFAAPAERYTRTLIDSIPRIDAAPPGAAMSGQVRAAPPLLAVERVSYRYRPPWSIAALFKPRTMPSAVQEVSFELRRGEILGLVGESGSGKSTIANILCGLVAPSSGEVRFDGAAIGVPVRQRAPGLRRRIQVVFQDPLSSLNPRRRVQSILMRPLQKFFGLEGKAARDRAVELLEHMELSAELLTRFPRQLSGGQQQRVAIARAFAAEPDLILCDEITSALDVSVQAHVLQVLKAIQARTGAACLFISHNLGVIRSIADRTIVLRDGREVESGATAEVFEHPRDAYTRLLLAAAARDEEAAEHKEAG